MEGLHGSSISHAKSHSETSSSSSSSNDDFFQLEASELNKSAAGVGVPPPAPSGHRDGEGLCLRTDALELDNLGSLGLPPRYGGSVPSGEFNRLSGVTQADMPPFGGNPFSLDGSSTTQSPPIQVMGKLETPDPNRIPSSIFVRTKSTTPMEWSVASNESLFSIHVGNNSFSRDHMLMLGRSGELNTSLDPCSPGPSGCFSLPVTEESPRNGLDLQNEDCDLTDAANAQAMNDVLRATVDEQGTRPPSSCGGTAPHSPTMSRQSDESGASIRSFAFPILTREGGRSVSMKMEQSPQHKLQQSPSQQKENAQEQESAGQVTVSNVQTKWFPCFSCCPFCC